MNPAHSLEGTSAVREALLESVIVAVLVGLGVNLLATGIIVDDSRLPLLWGGRRCRYAFDSVGPGFACGRWWCQRIITTPIVVDDDTSEILDVPSSMIGCGLSELARCAFTEALPLRRPSGSRRTVEPPTA